MDALFDDYKITQIKDEVERLKAEITRARQLLAPDNRHHSLLDAVRNMLQVKVSAQDNCDELEEHIRSTTERSAYILGLELRRR